MLFSEQAISYKLGCGTVRVELKLRFTGYRLRFTVSGYDLKNILLQKYLNFFIKNFCYGVIKALMFPAPKEHLRERPLQNIV